MAKEKPLPSWWRKWSYICTTLIGDKRKPDPETDIEMFTVLALNNDKEIDVVLREAVNFLIGHNGDGSKPYKRSRSFIANQFGKTWGGKRLPAEVAMATEHDYLDRLVAEDGRNLGATRRDNGEDISGIPLRELIPDAFPAILEESPEQLGNGIGEGLGDGLPKGLGQPRPEESVSKDEGKDAEDLAKRERRVQKLKELRKQHFRR